MTIKATVREGRLVVNEPTTLPEGTCELLPLDPGDWLDDADRAALHAALAQSDADVAAGRLVDAADVLKPAVRSHIRGRQQDGGPSLCDQSVTRLWLGSVASAAASHAPTP